MLQGDEKDLQEEETQVFFGLIDKHHGTERKMLDVQSTAESEARCESKGRNDASRIPEEEYPRGGAAHSMVLVDGARIF